MHGNCAFNSHIRVLLGCVKILVFAVERVEATFDFSATRELCLRWATNGGHATSVPLALDLILVSLHKLSDHIPKQVFLVFGA